MLISFLKKEEGEESGSKFMDKGDIIFFFVIATLVFGFWYYHTSTKEKAYSHYVKCDALYAANNLKNAKECYEKAINLDYRIDSLDSIGYHRRERIDSILGD